MSDQPREIRVHATWESTHYIEVPADWVDDGSLSFTKFEDIRSDTASLVDWEVQG